MSKFSGKCDCYDCIIEGNMDWQHSEIYIGKSNVPLSIHTKQQLIPYYPYIVTMSYFDTDRQVGIIRLSSDSYVNIEEQDCLNVYLKLLLNTYKKYKRKHKDITVDDLVKDIGISRNDDILQLLANEIIQHGKKATVGNLRMPMYENYRELLVQEMIKNGLNPIDYGYGRFVDN